MLLLLDIFLCWLYVTLWLGYKKTMLLSNFYKFYQIFVSDFDKNKFKFWFQIPKVQNFDKILLTKFFLNKGKCCPVFLVETGVKSEKYIEK